MNNPNYIAFYQHLITLTFKYYFYLNNALKHIKI